MKILLCLLLLSGTVYAANTELVAAEHECSGQLTEYRQDARAQRSYKTLLTILGALISAGFGLWAGFIDHDVKRSRILGVSSVIGGLVTTIGASLTAGDMTWELYRRAAKHHDIGAKIARQIPYLSNNTNKLVAEQYVMARYSDCLALEPTDSVPDLPNLITGAIVPTGDHFQATDAPPPDPSFEIKKKDKQGDSPIYNAAPPPTKP
jgi:hypothetical protein